MQTRAVTHLLTGHNTLRKHFYIIRLFKSPLCRWCGEEKETSAHILYECDALASRRHTYLGSFFMDPEDVICLSRRAIWNFSKGTGLPWPGHQIMGHEGPVKKSYVHRECKGLNPFTILFYSVLFYSTPYSIQIIGLCNVIWWITGRLSCHKCLCCIWT